MRSPLLPGALWVVLLAAGALGACSREEGLACESSERYTSAISTPPLRVPDDLSVPDETDVLRIPDPSPAEPTDDQQPCLESPPDFFSGAEPAEG